MQKFKKIMALALAMVMVVGGSMTAFAEEPTSGSTTGTGTSEGHVDKHVIKVVLPTVPDGSTPFAYTMDAERLIQETTGAKYANAVFPEKATDTGVYFITGNGADTYTVADVSDSYVEFDAVTEEAVETGDFEVGTTDVSSYYIVNEDGEFEQATGTYVDGTDYYTITLESVEGKYTETEGVYSAASGTAVLGTKYYTKNTIDMSELYVVDEDEESGYKATTDVTPQPGTTYYTKTAGTGKTTYANESSKLTVESQSSADVTLTVEVEASKADTDIKLVDTAPTDAVTDAELYLALVIGSSETAVKAGDKISKTVTIAGKDSNFETVVSDGKYVYAPKENETLTWNTEAFSLKGAVSEASAEGLTAPTLTVTWSYVDPAAVPANEAPSIANDAVSVAAGNAATVTVDLGSGELGATDIVSVSFVNASGVTKVMAEGTGYTFDGSTLTILAAAVDAIDGSRVYTITFDDTAGTTKTFTVTKTS